MIAETLLMFVWAARENLRRPWSNLLLAVCLAGLTLSLSLVLIIADTLERTSVNLLNQGPDLVVRRLDTFGWQPIPVAAALKAVAGLPGINRVRPRVWGLVQNGNLSITVTGADPAMEPAHRLQPGLTAPARGHAIVGKWWRPDKGTEPLVLSGHRTMSFKVDAALPPGVDLAAYDTVLLHPMDARALLGLAEGWASDLALYVFHPQEAEALRPELRKALPWPATIRTRMETLEWYRSGFGRRSSLVVLLWLPAIAALGLMVLAVIQQQARARHHTGLLKALGWTTGDILRLHLYQALVVALPSITLGLALAYTLTGGAFTDELARILLGWRGNAPARTLAPGSSFMILLEVSAFILLPYLAAVLGPALKSATADPEALLNKEI